ncbi:MAG: branched-chain amino acid ABC transporter permease [Verrucomicrobiota bacterium]|nr:branched-chain amino acid ABC transporter permease [Verrucomicrobiota bacterium]
MSGFIQQLLNGLSVGSIYALIALGYTMVYGVLRLINFAHGDVYMVGAMTGIIVSGQATRFEFIKSLPPSVQPLMLFLIILMSSMLICALLGYLIERFAYRPLRKAPKITLLITAIGVSLLIQYGGQSRLVFGPNPRVFPDIIPSYNLIPSISFSNIDALILGLSLVFMGVLFWIVQKTKLGRAMRAVSENPTVASLMGINVNKVISFTFILGSVLAACAGILVGLKNHQADPLMGMQAGIKAFAAAVLGGIGSIPGAVIGGLIIGISEALVKSIDSAYADAISFIILVIILLVKPSGIMGKHQIEKV